jgi:NADPH-dependent glutamate synthase beta subunit-like oxidoreductase
VERFLGDMALEQGWPLDAPPAPTGRRVPVVGAGPGGLSAAYHLRRLGHDVVVRDAGPVAGGMMHFGIPAYRLPRAVLDAEVARVAALGVTFEFNHTVEHLEREFLGRRPLHPVRQLLVRVPACRDPHEGLPGGQLRRRAGRLRLGAARRAP